MSYYKQFTLDEFMNAEAEEGRRPEVTTGDVIDGPEAKAESPAQEIPTKCQYEDQLKGRRGFALHPGAVHIFYYPEFTRVLANVKQVFSKCPPSCLEKAISDLKEIVELVRGYGVEVFRISKYYSNYDDLIFTVRSDRDSWERALKALEERGLRRELIRREDFGSYAAIQRIELSEMQIMGLEIVEFSMNEDKP